MFVDPANGNFYLAPGAVAIDSAIDSLEDRPSLISIKDPLGIGLSPVKAPDRDITGVQRTLPPLSRPEFAEATRRWVEAGTPCPPGK